MPRTPEQVAADQALTDAITAVRAAYDPDVDTGVLTEYIVVSAWSTWDSDGDGVSTIMSTPMDGDVPLHRLLGLLDYSLARYRSAITEDTDV